MKYKRLRISFFFFCLFCTASLAYGLSTLPTNLFPSGSQQYLLPVNSAQKWGTYGYRIKDIPKSFTDSISNNSPTMRLFELWPDGSAKELVPANSRHSDISDLGGGRFSFKRTDSNNYYIVISASDATDPRSNGRGYLLVQPSSNSTTDKVGSFYDSKTKISQYYLITSDPKHRTLVISNPSNGSYTFNLAFNQNGFLQSSTDLKTEIQNNIPEFDNEPTERKAWRFVRDNRIHGVPYSSHMWYHSPLLMFNSAGWGFCDDSASALMHTAALFGISGRVWGLNGHIVPELYTNGSWHLYDPDYETYFIDSTETNNVASINTLISDKSLITDPLQSSPWTPVTSSLIEKISPISNYGGISAADYADYYSSDDRPVEKYNTAPVPETPMTFSIPSGGSVEIGAHGSSDAPTTFNEQGIMAYQKLYSSVKITLPKSSYGELKTPLIPYKITGNGTATLYFQDGSTNTIPAGSDWNIYDENDRDSFITKISYNAGNGGMVIHYLANAIRSSVRGFNSVVMKPSSSMSPWKANPLKVEFKVTQ